MTLCRLFYEVLPEDTTTTVCRKKEFEKKVNLQIAFPYGINAKIGEEHQRDSNNPIGIIFPSIKRNKKHPTRQRNQAK